MLLNRLFTPYARSGEALVLTHATQGEKKFIVFFSFFSSKPKTAISFPQQKKKRGEGDKEK